MQRICKSWIIPSSRKFTDKDCTVFICLSWLLGTCLFSLPGNHRVAGTSDNCLLMRGRFGEESECSVETWPRSFECFCWTIYMGLSKNKLPKNPIVFSSFKTIWVGGIPRFQTYRGKRACGSRRSRRSRRSRCTIPDFEPDQVLLECWPHLKPRFCAVPKDRNCSITKLQRPVVPKQLKYIYTYTKVEVQRKCPSICQDLSGISTGYSCCKTKSSKIPPKAQKKAARLQSQVLDYHIQLWGSAAVFNLGEFAGLDDQREL